MTNIEIRRLSTGDLESWNERVAAMEGDVEYPLGPDWFHIDHGADYFAFFRRMGELAYFVALDGERLVGVVAAVRCQHPDAWYLCDLKVRPEDRGRPIAARLAAAFLAHCLAGTRRSFAISMNPAEGENRVVRLLLRLAGERAHVATQLNLYSLDAGAMHDFAPTLTRLRGPLSYLSLAGMKDIVLRSTGQPMPLLHAQFGPRAAVGIASPQADHAHMFCAPVGDALDHSAMSAGHAPTATATVVHADLDDTDWDFVLTSDI